MIEPRLELARIKVKEGALSAAYRDYLRVAEQDPQNLEANIFLGQIAFQSGDWTAFERYASKSIELASDDPAARVLDLAARYRSAALNEDSPARSDLLAEAEDV